jgi:hypothetical protein
LRATVGIALGALYISSITVTCLFTCLPSWVVGYLD